MKNNKLEQAFAIRSYASFLFRGQSIKAREKYQEVISNLQSFSTNGQSDLIPCEIAHTYEMWATDEWLVENNQEEARRLFDKAEQTARIINNIDHREDIIRLLRNMKNNLENLNISAPGWKIKFFI